MDLHVKPTSVLRGRISLPGSKSYSIRAFLVACCGGNSTIKQPSNSDDCIVAVNVAKALGSKITQTRSNHWRVLSSSKRKAPSVINVKESGTVLRLLLPLLGLYNSPVKVKGEGTLRGRPNHFLVKALKKMGMAVAGQGPKQCVPLLIKKGNFHGGAVAIDGSVSSQFISALLISCPQLKENSRITLKGKLVSQDYITMTQQVLRASGVNVKRQGSRFYFIKGAQRFKGLKNFVVPSDLGLAAFHLAAAALSDSHVTLKGNLSQKFIQADGAILPLLRKMGVRFTKNPKEIKINGPFALKGGSFSLKDCPDLVPIMAVLALFAKGRTRLYDIAHARVKESDRISDLRRELLKIGADVKETKNELIILPKKQYREQCILNPHKDHRLAMAFSVLGLKLGVRVKDIECVSKSYPDFVRDFKVIGARASKIN